MTTAEFNRWWEDVCLRWPSVSTWLAKCFPDGSRQQALLRTWRDVLASVTLDDCLEVNRQMQAGELAWVGEYDADKERLPQHVRRLARQLAWEREGRREPAEQMMTGNKGSSFPAGKLLMRWQELQAAGFTREESREMALREFPVGESRFREHRYNCAVCLDSGRVLVASPSAIRAMALDTFETCHHRLAVARCHCDLGSRLVRKNQGRDVKFEMFNATLDFAISDPLWRPAEVERFRGWVDAQQQRRAGELWKPFEGQGEF